MRTMALLVGFVVALLSWFSMAGEQPTAGGEASQPPAASPPDVVKDIEQIKQMIMKGKLQERAQAAARIPGIGVERFVKSFTDLHEKRRFTRRLMQGSWTIEASAARLLVFLEILKDEDEDLRRTSLRGVEMLVMYGNKPKTLEGLAPLLKDKRETVRLDTLQTLKALGKPGVVQDRGFVDIKPNDVAEVLLRIVGDESNRVRARVFESLPEGTDSKTALEALRKALDDPAPVVRTAALATLIRLNVREPKMGEKALAMSTADQDVATRRTAIQYLGKSRYEPAFPVLIKILTENRKPLDDPKKEELLAWSKIMITYALTDFAKKEARPHLIEAALNDERYPVQWRSAHTYQILVGKDFGFFDPMAKAEATLALKKFRLWYLSDYEQGPKAKPETVAALKEEIAALEKSSRFDIVLQLLLLDHVEAYQRGLTRLREYGVEQFFSGVSSVETMRQLAQAISRRPVSAEHMPIVAEALVGMLDSEDEGVLLPVITAIARFVTLPDPELVLKKFEALAKSENRIVARMAQMNLPHVQMLVQRKKQQEEQQKEKETPKPEKGTEKGGS